MKVIDKKIGDKTYFKYRINLPISVVEDSKLLNKNLKIKNSNSKIIIEEER